MGFDKSPISEILFFIKCNYSGVIVENDTSVLKHDELCIYLPELKLAIDYNNLSDHCELYKSKKYHIGKTEACEKNGIKLIHIYEDDWNIKTDIIKSRLLNLIGAIPTKYYARKCVVKELTTVKDNQLIKPFLVANHMQGFVGAKIKIGLFCDGELVSLMTFGERRVAMGVKKNSDGEYEMLRFCNKINVNVVGGASKIFKYFLTNYNPRLVTTYADRSWSRGELYEKLGFLYLYKTEPNYYYILENIRKHRFNFRKDLLIKQGFDGSKTEVQIMHDRGLYRMFDSGNVKFEYININYKK